MALDITDVINNRGFSRNSEYSRSKEALLGNSLKERMIRKIERVGIAVDLDPSLRITLKELYQELLNTSEIRKAIVNSKVNEILEDVFLSKIAHPIVTVASIANMHKALTGEVLPKNIVVAIAVMVSAEIDWTDSTSEGDKRADFQIPFFSYMLSNLTENTRDILPNISNSVMSQEEFSMVIEGIRKGLLSKFQNVFNSFDDSPENKRVFVSFLEKKIKDYFLEIAFEHVRSPKESQIILNQILEGQVTEPFINPLTSRFIESERIRYEKTKDIHSPYFESLTNALKFIVATYFYFAKNELPGISQIQNTTELMNLVNTSTNNFATYHLAVDDALDVKDDQKSKVRNLIAGLTDDEASTFISQLYNDALVPVRELGKDNRTIKALEIMVKDIAIFYSSISIKQRDGSYKFFERIIKQQGLQWNLRKVVMRALYARIFC